MEHSDRQNPFVNRQPLTRGGREAFLARVRKGLGHAGRTSPPPPGPPPPRDEALIRQVGASCPNLVGLWQKKAAGNSMIVHRIEPNQTALTSAIDAAFSGHKIAKTILNTGDLESRFQLAAQLNERGIEVFPWGAPKCSEVAFHCDASITDCRAGLADTGAVMVWSDAGFGRSSTLVVPVHVILLPASRIVPDMIDAFELLLQETAGALPSNVIVINGPSKTVDIEMNLVTGVHGPKYLHVIVIDGI